MSDCFELRIERLNDKRRKNERTNDDNVGKITKVLAPNEATYYELTRLLWYFVLCEFLTSIHHDNDQSTWTEKQIFAIYMLRWTMNAT